MKAMILAAGEGRRMLPLTLERPKPLLMAGGQTLIEHHIGRLKQAGIVELVVNVSYLGQQIMEYLGDGSRLGVSISYSVEDELLETGGAIKRALPLLGEEPFVLVNGDVWTDFDFSTLTDQSFRSAIHLVLVVNPEHNPGGDFVLQNGQVVNKSPGLSPNRCLTFAGISVIDPLGFRKYPHCREKFPLKEVLSWMINQRALTGEQYTGQWIDVGTPERLELVRRVIQASC